MNINEYAKQRGTTPQAVYKRLKSAGISAKQITDPSTKEITPDGEAVLIQLYKQPMKQIQPTADVLEQPTPDVLKRVQELQTEVETLKRERDLLEVKLAAANEKADLLQQTLSAERGLFLPAAENVKKLQEEVVKLKSRGLFARIRNK